MTPQWHQLTLTTQSLAGQAASPGDRVAVSIVSPCYNEEGSLCELHRRVSRVCQDTARGGYEIVLVDDGSKDATWPLIKAISAQDPHVVSVKLARNYGHQLALSAGLSLCSGERILIIDADLQDPPELLPEMMALMDRGADVVFGQRRSRAGETAFKKVTASLFYRILSRLIDIQIPMDTGDFRLISRRTLDVLNHMPEQHRFIRGMIGWIGLQQVPILYDRQSRFAGETNYPVAKMLRFAIDAITGFSIRPLRAASYFGIFFGAVGMLLLAYSLIRWFLNETIQGWTSIMATVTIIGSVQLMMLGIMGEYLGRLYTEAKHRPLYVIEEIEHAQLAHDAAKGPAVVGARSAVLSAEL